MMQVIYEMFSMTPLGLFWVLLGVSVAAILRDRAYEAGFAAGVEEGRKWQSHARVTQGSY